MASAKTMYNYVDKYIKEFSTSETKGVFNQMQVFLYMALTHDQNESVELYRKAMSMFKTNKEFKEIVIGCLGNMKEVYGNSEEFNFDEIYKDCTGDKNSSLDEDYSKLDSRYKRNHKPREVMRNEAMEM